MSSLNLGIDYSKGSLSSFIPTDVNQGWVIDPAVLTRNIEYLATSLSFSSELLENKFYDLVTKVFADKNYLQALQTEYLKLPSGTVNLTNVDDYVESLYQAIILYAILEEFTPSVLNNVSTEAENQILKVLNLVITSGFQQKLDTAFATMDFSGLDNSTLNTFIDTIYTTLGSAVIPRAPSFDLVSTTPSLISISVRNSVTKYLDLFQYITLDNPSDIQDIKCTFTFDEDQSTTGYVRSDWEFTSGRLSEITNFGLYTDVAGNNSNAIIQILPGTQISFSKHIPGSNLLTVTSNRYKTHPNANLVCTFTDSTYVDDTILDTTGKILGKRQIKLEVKYKELQTNITSTTKFVDTIIPIDTKTWMFDQVIPIFFEKDYTPPGVLRLANTTTPLNSITTNLTDIGTVRLGSDNFSLEFIPNSGIDLQTALPGKYFEFDWVEGDLSYVINGHNKYTFVSRIVPNISKQSIFEIVGSATKSAKIDSYYADNTALSRLSDFFSFNLPEEVYNMDYVFSIDKSLSDASWVLTYLNGIYIFDCPKATIKIRKSLAFSNDHEFSYVLKGLNTLNDYTYAELQTLPLIINIAAIDRLKYIDDNTLDSSNKIYGKREIKFQPVSHYRGSSTNTFSAEQNVGIKLDRNFTGFILPDGDGGSAIQYITAKYLIDPTKKDTIKTTVTVVSTTLPASQVVQVANDKLYFNSVDTLASPLDRTKLDQTVLDILDAGQLSELGALYANKEVKIRIQINDRASNNVLLDAIQTIKFIPYIV